MRKTYSARYRKTGHFPFDTSQVRIQRRRTLPNQLATEIRYLSVNWTKANHTPIQNKKTLNPTSAMKSPFKDTPFANSTERRARIQELRTLVNQEHRLNNPVQCAYCGQTIPAEKRLDAKYCSASCRVDASATAGTQLNAAAGLYFLCVRSASVLTVCSEAIDRRS